MPLTVTRPTHSTVLFSYSRSPRLKPAWTIAAHIIASAALLLVLYLALHAATNHNRLLRRFLPSPTTFTQTPLLAGTYTLLLATVLYYSRLTPVEETLLVMRSLGIQTTSRRRVPLLSTSRFIPASQLADIVINEGFKGLEVKSYLAAIIKNEDQLVVVFPNFLPRRHVLERIWNISHDVLGFH